MTSTDDEWFLTERTRALAIMHLTRRDDLKVMNPGDAEDHGIALLVNLEKPSSRSLRPFGVALDASVSPTTEVRLNKALRSRIRTFLRSGDYPYPVCLFYFTMQDNKGYFTWLGEPVVTKEGQPQLLRREKPDCKPLEREALDAIVGQVDCWYDAFYTSLTATAI